MAIHVVRLGERRLKKHGILFGTVRRPPMFKPKGSAFDVWLPELSPSAPLLKRFRTTNMTWNTFAQRYRGQMKKPTPKRLITMLAALSHERDLSISCFCEDESQCHRSILSELLAGAGATIVRRS